MARPAKPDYVNDVLLIVAIVMMCFDATLLKAFGAICGSCQLSSFYGIRNRYASTGKHSRMFDVSIAPSLFIVLMPLSYLFSILFFIAPFDYSTLVSVLFLPFSIVGFVGFCIFVGHTTILAQPPALSGILQLALSEV